MIKYIYNRKLSLLSALAVLLALGGCTDNFQNWNTNPHEATEEMMEKDNLATGAYFVQMQKNVFVLEQLPEIGASVFQTIQNLAGDIYSGYMGACGTWNSGYNNTTYDMSLEWKDAGFERAFVGVMPAWNAIVKKAEEMQQPQVVALATIVKVEAMHRVTDMYGPLPYISFGNGEMQNAYDSQEDIYNMFFEELDEAIEVLTDFYQKDPMTRVLENYDFVYNGNVENWLRFANTLKLRLAMRIVYANPSKAQMMAEAAVKHSIGVMTKASDMARLQHTSDFNYRHPLYIVGQGEFNDNRMGATIDSYMNGYADPRLSSYFKLSTAGKYTGIRTGISIIRENYAEKAPFSDLNIEASSDLVWMNPAEAWFLRAEGAIRGWDMGGGTAKEFYESGVRTSFEHAGVSGADAYLADDQRVPAAYTDPSNNGNSISEGSPMLGTITIKWDESETNFEVNLERIITQKWLAVFPDGQEAWSDYRRTGYPKIFPVRLNRSGGQINTDKQIRRIPFSTSEYRDNRENVTQAAVLLGGDDNGGTSLWWDKKN